MFVQLSTLTQAANLLLLKFTKTLLAPALTDPDQDRKDEFHHTALVPEMGDNLRPSPFFLKGPLGEVRGAHVLLMPLGNVEMIETGLSIVEQAATRLGKVPLLTGDNRLPALLSRQHGRCIPHVDHQGFELRPGLWRDFLL